MRYLVGSEEDIKNNFITSFSNLGINYVVYFYKESICIFNAKCPHAYGDLRQASYENGYIKCPSHGLKFNVRTGDVDLNEITDDFRNSIISKGIEKMKLKILNYEKLNGMIYVDI